MGQLSNEINNGGVYLAFAGLYFRDRYELTLAAASVLVGSSVLCLGIFQFLVSLLLDLGVRLAGRKWMILRTPIMNAAAWAIMSLGATPVTGIIGLAFVGLSGAATSLMLAAFSEHSTKEKAGTVNGVLNAAQIAGQLAALGLGFYFVRQGLLHGLFLSVCLMWVGVTIILFFLIPSDHPAPGPEDDLTRITGQRFAESARELGRMFADRETRAIKFLLMVAGVGPVLASTYIPLYLISIVSDPGASASYIAVSGSLGAVLGMVLAPALGAFSDRKKNEPQLLLGVLLLLAVALLAMVGVHAALVISALAVVVAVAAQWLTLLQNAILLRRVSTERSTTFFLANQMPYYAGFPVGLIVAIGVIGMTGSVVNALALVGVLYAVGAVVWFKPMRHGDQRCAVPGLVTPA